MVRFGVYFDQILSLKNFYKFFFKLCRNTYYSCTHMLGNSGAYASCHDKILKMWCSLVRFGEYFDQIVS